MISEGGRIEPFQGVKERKPESTISSQRTETESVSGSASAPAESGGKNALEDRLGEESLEKHESMKDYRVTKSSSFSKNRSSRNLSRFSGSGFLSGFRFPSLSFRIPGGAPILLFIPLLLLLLAPVGGYLFLKGYSMVTAGSVAKFTRGMEPILPNRILDRNGELLAELFSEKTGNLKPEEIPVSLKNKLLFVEDESFYSHGAIDWFAMTRAIFTNLISARYSQGASTITQQTSRILLNERQKTIFRKLREASLAYLLEDRYSKDQILAAYMNLVYLGHGAVGMQNAAEFYFGENLNDLSFVEELILVCLPSAPERYSPLRNPSLLAKKMDAVYERMVDEGFSGVPEKVEYEAKKASLFRSMNRSPSESVFGTRIDNAPFVSEYIRQKIGELLGDDFQFGAGLVIETTLDAKFQNAASEISSSYIKEIAQSYRPVRMERGRAVSQKDPAEIIKNYYNKMGPAMELFGYPGFAGREPRLQTASVGIDPTTGAVLFMQGGTEFSSKNQLNRAVSMRRQTGSAVKPVVYAAAIASGVATAATELDDTPLFVSEIPKNANDPGYWIPENITGVYEGKITVRRALMKSKNVPAIRLAEKVGLERLATQFRNFFFSDDREFERRFRSDYTIAIGSLEMSPLEMAVAFSAFGNNGVIRRPYMIRRILSSEGKVLFDGTGKDEFGLKRPLEQKVMTGDVAQVMASLMRDSGKYGGVSRGGFSSGDLLGKTGTTNDNRDAWFVGVVPGVAAALWVGFDEPAYSMPGGTGSSVAGPLWGRIFSRAYQDKGGFVFDPAAVERVVCEGCDGKLADDQCPDKKTEIFALVSIPGEVCTDFQNSKQEAGDAWNLNRDSDFN